MLALEGDSAVPVSQFRMGEKLGEDIGGVRGEDVGDAVATELSNNEQAC